MNSTSNSISIQYVKVLFLLKLTISNCSVIGMLVVKGLQSPEMRNIPGCAGQPFREPCCGDWLFGVCVYSFSQWSIVIVLAACVCLCVYVREPFEFFF